MSSLAWIGWVLTAIGLVTGYLYFRANRKIKRIEWWIDSDQDLINFPGTDLAEDITVLVNGDQLKHPRAVQITIKNTGSVGLDTSKMYRSFTINCTGPQQMYAASVRRTLAKQNRSEDVPTIVMVGPGGEAGPQETLLNPGDYLTCQLLVDGAAGRVEVMGEAEDFEISYLPTHEYKQLQLKRQQDVSRRIAIVGVATALLVSVVAGISSLIEGN